MVSNSVTTQAAEVISHHGFASVLLNNASNQKSVHAAVPFNPGDIICTFRAATTSPEPSYLTIQTGTDTHITLDPGFLQYTNHSCSPTAFFDTGSMELICLRALEPGAEISFFYPGTEWEMAQPFVCNCGEPGCIQLINGASHLSVNTLSKYKLTDFIRQQVRLKLSL